MKILLVVDMQNDFVVGNLGTKEAVAIVPNVVKKINEFSGEVIFTKDTHSEDYLTTQEGKNLPVPHCIKGSHGWKFVDGIDESRALKVFEKESFGSAELGPYLVSLNQEEKIEEVEVIGVCTDVCVIINAMVVKTFLPEVKVTVDSSCCAGVNPGNHSNALDAMKSCQIEVI